MTHSSSEPSAPAGLTATTLDERERWAAWHARGAEHDRAVRRRMTFVAPTLIVGIMIVVVLLSR